MKYLTYIYIICTLFGCERRPIVLETGGDCIVGININWSKLPIKPLGMSLRCYPRSGRIPTIVQTNNVDETTVKLKEGIYDIVIFNQIPSDFRRLKFIGLDLYHTIEIGSVPVVTYADWLEGIQLHENPEHFASETLEGFEVSPDMIKIQSKETAPIHSINFTPEKATYLLKVKIDIKNIQYLRSVRSVICNLSGSYRICNSKRENGDASHSLDQWNLFINKEDNTRGYITSSIEVFGIPDDESIVKMLKVYVQLKDAELTEVAMEFVVDKELEIDNTKMEITLNLQVEDPLPEIDIEGDDGGFDADIVDWEDDVIQDVEI